MTFNIPTPGGIVEVRSPFRLNKKGKARLKKVFVDLSSPHDPLPGEKMDDFLKRTTPGIESPVGTVKGLLTLYDWSQKELSKRSGLSVSVICDILKERRSIGMTTAGKLAKALNIDYRDLL